MKNIYQLKNIILNYDNNILINDLNLEISKSKITGLIGPNGSGKTTLLNILSFLSFPKSVKIFYDGVELRKDNIKTFRNSVGYVQQDPYLFRGTVYKNIEIGLKLKHINYEERIQRIKKILSLLRIEHLSARLSNSLSGGEARKVAIAQILVLDPDVLIMDEPFSNLDKNSVLELEELIIFINTRFNKTIIFTTHDQVQAQKLTSTIYSFVKGMLFSTDLINLFKGKLVDSTNKFDTGKQLITIYNNKKEIEYVAIDPRQVVLSLKKLDSSMQNSFLGKIISMEDSGNYIKLNINIGEEIQTIITHKAFNDLELTLNMNVWVSFKSASVMVY